MTPKEKRDTEAVLKLLAQTVKRENGYVLMNIISSFRGPDTGNNVLKDLTTCRLRAFFVPKQYIQKDEDNQLSAGGLTIRMVPLTVDEMKIRDEMLKMMGSYHFKNHYKWGCDAIRHLYKYDLMEEKKL